MYLKGVKALLSKMLQKAVFLANDKTLVVAQVIKRERRGEHVQASV